MIVFFFFNDTATTEIYTLSLHDALPISLPFVLVCWLVAAVMALGAIAASDAFLEQRDLQAACDGAALAAANRADRKSTRLNSSHANISYAVFCLKKKNR